MPWLLGLLYSVPLTPHQAIVDPCLHRRLLDTHGQVWLSLLWGHCSFLLGCGTHKLCLFPPKAYFPSLWKFCNQIPLAFKVKFCGGSQALCRILRLRNLLWALEVWELLWYNYLPVCGSSAWWLYGGANGKLLQEDLCHMLHLPSSLQPDPQSPWQVTATFSSTRDTQTLRLRFGSASLHSQLLCDFVFS